MTLDHFRLNFSDFVDMLLVIECPTQQTYKDLTFGAIATYKILRMLFTNNPKRSILCLLLKIRFECFGELEDFIVYRTGKAVFLRRHELKEAHETEHMTAVNHNLLSFGLVEGLIASLAG